LSILGVQRKFVVLRCAKDVLKSTKFSCAARINMPNVPILQPIGPRRLVAGAIVNQQ
jgi:hypothetical protein